MVMAPISLDTVADVLYKVGLSRSEGIVQASGACDISYADAAKQLAERLHADPRLVAPISVVESDVQLEHVPSYTTLDCTRAAAELQFDPPIATDVLDQVMSSL
jgi:dTDP-4-dehydrorhamnose reductase